MSKSSLLSEPFEFLALLEKNNNREWFKQNKERYTDDVVEPVCDFIEAMEPRLHAISEHFVADPRPHGGSMFRIYRDTRFTKDNLLTSCRRSRTSPTGPPDSTIIRALVSPTNSKAGL